MSEKNLVGVLGCFLLATASVSYIVFAEGPPAARVSREAEARSGIPRASAVRQPAGIRPAASVATDRDETAVRALGDSLMEAYRQKNALAFASIFTEHGEYVDAQESLVHGRAAIEQEFGAFFQSHPAAVIEMALSAIRSIAPNVVKVQGTTVFRRESAASPARGRCTIVCVRDGDRWQIASLREMDSEETPAPHEQLQQLKWMIGEWLSEGPQSDIQFSCNFDSTGNFLIRNFSIRAAGRPPISGTQRIGYDPLSGRLKSWVFDSDGGFSEGYFHPSHGGWTLHSTGVTAAGDMASVNEVFTLVDAHRISWDIADRIVAGNRIADMGQISIVRQPPAPSGLSTAGEKRTPQ